MPPERLEKNVALVRDEGSDGAEGEPAAVSGAVAHPTLIPAFDPSQYAEDAEVRERMATITDEDALEHARLQSFPSEPPRGASTRSAANAPSMHDALVVTDASEEDIEGLPEDEQIAILRAELMPLTRVPVLAHAMSELGAALADTRTAYVLGFVDGILPLETILDVTGLPELDTLRVLDRMVTEGVVLFRPVRSSR